MSDQLDISARLLALAGDPSQPHESGAYSVVCDVMRDAAAEIARLRRWKSTHAPRLEALEGLLRASQQEAHAGREAVATLASERAANALLTNEVERLRNEIQRLREWIAVDGLHSDTCTRNVLGRVCDGCRCGRAVVDA